MRPTGLAQPRTKLAQTRRAFAQRRRIPHHWFHSFIVICSLMPTLALAQQPSSAQRPTRTAQQTAADPASHHAAADSSETAGLRPSIPQAAWTGAAATVPAAGGTALSVQHAETQRLPTSVPQSAVQPASYSEQATSAAAAPTVYSAGVSQRLGSVPQPSPTPSPAMPPSNNSKERHRIPLAANAGDEPATASSGSSIRPLISMVTSLLIVLGLFLGMVWVYRKSSNHATNSIPKQVVQVLGRAPLASRQHLVVIRFGSKLVLVSLAQGETRTLGEITDPLEVDQLAGLCESTSPNSLSNSFRNILSQGGTQA